VSNVRARWTWVTAVVLYGAFSFWYDSWRGPLTPPEIDDFLRRAGASMEVAPDRLASLRSFLEADDGREFFMLNLVRLHDGPVQVPSSVEEKPAREVLEGYAGVYMPALFWRAGHPAFFGRAAGGYVEHWGVEPDPHWSFAGVIRYRSRRDLMALVTDPRFAPAHAFKLAAIANTLAFPASPALVFFGPRIWVALVLALAAALGHLVYGRQRPAQLAQ